MKIVTFVLLLIINIGVGFKIDIQDNAKYLLNLENNEDFSYMPMPDGTMRLVSVNEIKTEYEKTANLARSGPIPVTFYLYTRINPTNAQTVYLNDIDALKKSNFDPIHETKFITHGWRNNFNSSVNILIRDAFLSQGDYNIFVVDWSYAAHTLNYYTARYSVEEVGKQISKYLGFLKRHGHMSFKKLQLIGHSLGAHCSGYAGKFTVNDEINSIIGLDPAGPLFSFSNPHERLADTDAKYVETIQTNGGFLGFLQPIGSATFYPNWGIMQPGCGMDVSGICSHERSYVLFAEAIRENEFVPTKCKNFNNFLVRNCDISADNVHMAHPLNKFRAEGLFYVPTKAQDPLDGSLMDEILHEFEKIWE